MHPGESDESETRLAAQAEEIDVRIAAGEVPPSIEPDSRPPAERSTLLAAQESLLCLERAWPRGGSHPGPAAGTGGDPGPGSELRPPPDFGRFRIIRELGRGGFGVVFLAIDPELGRPVALKLPRAEWLLDAWGRERFVREARAVAGLDHPNIVPLYEAGEVHGVCYMASAYCDGPDLAGWLREQRRRADPRTVARMVADLADAIQHAHERGILHRDLKPSNVLLHRPRAGLREHMAPPLTPPSRHAEPPLAPPSQGGDHARFGRPSEPLAAANSPPLCELGARGGARAQARASRADEPRSIPRIIDFGLARLMDRAGEELTASFAAVGSAPYMAPEQAEGKKVGPAADIYGLGALLYCMLCGRPPHRGRSDLDTLRRVVADEVVPPRRRRRDLPRDIEAICLKCLDKDPARRYADAGALRDDLRRFLAGVPTLARSRGRLDRARRAVRRHRRALTALGIIATAVAAVLVGIFGYETRLRATRELANRRAEEARRSSDAARHARYVADLRQAKPLIDGHHARQAIAILDRHRPGPGEPDFREFAWRYLRRRCDTSRQALAGFAGPVYFVEFSPTGDLLAAASKDGTVRIWKTGSWELLHDFRADRDEVNVATFSPDGAMLATVGDEGTFKLWEVVSERCRLGRPAHRGDAVVVRFTPDGKSLLTGGRKDGLLKLWDLARGVETRALRAHSPDFECAAASPDGRFLATTGSGDIKLWDTSRLSLIAESPRGIDPIQGAAFSRDGQTLAVATEGTRRVFLLGVPSLRPIREFAGHAEGVFSVAFSADDRTLFSAGDDETIRCWDVATGALKGIHHGHTGRIWGLAASPDGRTIASAGGDGTVKLWGPAPPRDHDDLTIEGPVAALQLSRGGERLASLDHRGLFSIRETDAGRVIHSRVLGRSAAGPAVRPPLGGAISEDLQTVLLVDADGAVTAWDGERGQFLSALGDRDGPVVSLGITADGRHASVIHVGRGVEIWDTRASRRLGVLEGAYGSATFLRDGLRLLVHDTDRNTPLLWDPTRRRVVRPPSDIYYIPGCLSFSPDGHRLAFSNRLSDGTDYRVSFIDTGRLIPLPSPVHSPARPMAMAFDPTGRILAAGCEDHRVRFWDIASGENLLTLEGHSGSVSRVDFFADGQTLATGASRPDGATEIFLWRAACR